jgi:hypothetical protein
MDKYGDFMCCIILTAITILICSIVIGAPILIYYQGCKRAEIFNNLNGSNYSCIEFAFASDQINSKTSTIKLQ